jgi:outer membrane protein assembly factor BamB
MINMNSYLVYRHTRQRTVPTVELNPPLRLSAGYPLTGVHSTPKIKGAYIYCSLQDGTLQSLDSKTLKSRWTYRPSSFDIADLYDGEMIIDGNRLIASFDARLTVIDALSGKLIQERDAAPFDMRSALAFNHRLVGLSFENDNWIYQGLDLNDLQTVWRYQGDDLQEFNASADNQLYFGDRMGGLFCLDTETGQLRWRFQLQEMLNTKATRKSPMGEVQGVPAIFEDLLFVAVSERWVIALERSSGSLVWARQLRCEDSSGMCCDMQGRIHLVDEYYTQLDATTGKVIYEMNVGDAHRNQGVYINTFATPAHKWLYFADVTSGTLVAMNANTGKIEWTYKCSAGLPLEQPPIIVEGYCYVTDIDGRLYRFESQGK